MRECYVEFDTSKELKEKINYELSESDLIRHISTTFNLSNDKAYDIIRSMKLFFFNSDKFSFNQVFEELIDNIERLEENKGE